MGSGAFLNEIKNIPRNSQKRRSDELTPIVTAFVLDVIV